MYKTKCLVYIFYAAATVALIPYSCIEKTKIVYSNSNLLYYNVRKCPAYMKKDFDPAALRIIPYKTALESGKTEYQDVPISGSGYASLSPFQSQLFNELAEALKSQKISEIKRILNILDQRMQDSKPKEILENISDQALMTGFDSTLKIIYEVLRI